MSDGSEGSEVSEVSEVLEQGLGLRRSGSEMGKRVRAFDRSKTPVGIVLHSRYPMFVWWGPERINIYNDAYVPILGSRHPDALGRSAQREADTAS